MLCYILKVYCVCSSACLLPVLVEEEESVQDSTSEAPTIAASMEGRKGKTLKSVCMKREKVFLSCLFASSYISVLLWPPTHHLFLPGTDQLTSSGATTFSDSSSPLSKSAFTNASQSGSGMGSVTSEPSQSEDSAAKKNSLSLCGKNKKELVRPALLPRSSQLTVRSLIPHINGDKD